MEPPEIELIPFVMSADAAATPETTVLAACRVEHPPVSRAVVTSLTTLHTELHPDRHLDRRSSRQEPEQDEQHRFRLCHPHLWHVRHMLHVHELES